MEILVIDTHVVPKSSYINNFKNTLEELGNRCEIRYFSDENLSSRIDQFDAVILSGSAAFLSQKETIKRYQAPIELVQSISTPILGICFGHQLLGVAFCSQVVPLGMEVKGFRPVKVLELEESAKKNDPLFDSLPNEIQVYKWHSEILDSLPKNFKLLASSKESAIEAMLNEKKLIYGIQFHAELYNSENQDGKVILQNFFNLLKK